MTLIVPAQIPMPTGSEVEAYTHPMVTLAHWLGWSGSDGSGAALGLVVVVGIVGAVGAVAIAIAERPKEAPPRRLRGATLRSTHLNGYQPYSNPRSGSTNPPPRSK